MAKHIITTVQVITRKYYVEVDDPTWAHDGIVMGELDEFSQQFHSEDIASTQTVEDFPKADQYESVNAATMKFNYDTESWESDVRWDLAK